jgi:hypothetical protein
MSVLVGKAGQKGGARILAGVRSERPRTPTLVSTDHKVSGLWWPCN